MPYQNRHEQNAAKLRSTKYRAGVPVREPLPPVKMRTPRQVILALEQSINRILADETIDLMAVNRAVVDNARIVQLVLASGLDARIDALEAQVRAAIVAASTVPAGTRQMQVAVVAAQGDDEDDGSIAKHGGILPLAGVAEDAEYTPIAPVKRPRGRPRKPTTATPVALNFIPGADDFNAALSEYVGRGGAGDAGADDEDS